jgi:hypothetical protein
MADTRVREDDLQGIRKLDKTCITKLAVYKESACSVGSIAGIGWT